MKWSCGTPSLPRRKNRRLVDASISRELAAPGPIRSSATWAFSSTLNAFVRGLDAASARRRRSASTTAVCLGDDHALAGAGRALAREDLARPVRDVLTRHLDEPERRDLDHVGLRPVALELLLERLLDRLPVLRVRHVDEVDDDDPADVAQAELADDFLDRLEVVLRDRVLEARARALRPRADEAARVHVDDRERLGVVEDQVAARRQVDSARERGADLGVDAVGLEQRRLVVGR